MKVPRPSIAEIMTVVGIVALNLAAARAFSDDYHELLCGVAPMAVTLQIGLLSLIRSRGRLRAFETGYAAFGSLAMASFVGAVFFCPSDSVTIDPKTGQAVVRTLPGAPIWVLWNRYGRLVFKTLESLPNCDFIVGDGGDSHGNDGVPLGTKALIFSLPQMVFAVAGGLLFSLIERRSREPRSRGRPPSQSCFGDASAPLERAAVFACHPRPSSVKHDESTSPSRP
jgi:hypothetical protein